ncbi:MAG: hypothetical protein Q8K86_05875 [Candidatus Nanopelagicaceae bacterium]|nr:hypothetical protein [Candidatus Nanopelagicaceae bacterium]
MKKILCLVAVALTTLVGCTPPKPETEKKIVVLVRTTAQVATEIGLKELDKKDHTLALTVAKETNKVIVEEVLPYLNGEATTAFSFAVNEALQLKFFAKLDASIKASIVAAAVVLDSLIQPPDPTKKLTPQELDYLKAFFEGVAAGCNIIKDAPPVMTVNEEPKVESKDVPPTVAPKAEVKVETKEAPKVEEPKKSVGWFK